MADIKKKQLSFPFSIDPWTHNSTLCDEAKHIQNSIMIILSTHVKERYMLTSFGSRLKDYVFENQQEETQEMIQREIIASLTLWEPRIHDISIQFKRKDSVLWITIFYRYRDNRLDSLCYPMECEGL